MKIAIVVSCVALVPLLAGCSVQSRVTLTPAAGVDEIPTTLAVYPILANQPEHRIVRARTRIHWYSLTEREDRIYIVPAAETKLLVTPHSEIFTGLVSSELSRFGFRLKALPLEVLEDDASASGNGRSFVVSLETIRYMREEYDLEALLIGNVFFIHDPYDPDEPSVRSFYLKIVDAVTLDVLCHVSNDYGELGEEIEDAAKDIGFELAKFAGLAESGEDDGPYTRMRAE